MKNIRLICRSSRLSIIQAQEVATSVSGHTIQIRPYESFGDKNKNISLLNNEISDFFTKELDEAILNGEADVAVHSARDLPYPMKNGLEIIALTPCLSSRDVLVSKSKKKLSSLPSGAKIGTSSQHRKEQISTLRSDIEIVSIQGTIDQRLEQLNSGLLDALILAECSLIRLGYEHLVTETLPYETHPLQGHLVVVAKVGNAAMKSIFYNIDVRRKYGKVSIAGFGPGNPELLTIKALNEIRKADIIYYDDLVDANFIQSFECEKMFVGKRKDKHEKTQDEINQLLYKSAIEGKRVVRLKGGDPQIFGRGGEEFDYLNERLVNVEIIPGITSALAAAAYSGIPLTMRNEAASVAFCLGYPAEKITVPNTDTIVYYMGASSLKEIAGKVIESGRSPQTPVALVQNASSQNQVNVYASLQQILDDDITVESPLIVIIGNHIKEKSFASNYIRNKVLVTGTNADNYEYVGEIIHTPLIEIRPLDNYLQYKQLFSSNNQDWIVFTSRYAVIYFLKALTACDKDIRFIGNAGIIAIGDATAKELLRFGLVADIISKNETTDGLVDLFVERQLPGKQVLILRSNLSNDTIPSLLGRMGYKVNAIPVYENVVPDKTELINLDNIDIVAFSSPSGVKNFKKLYEKLPEHINVISKGEVTLRSLYDTGLLHYEPEWVI